MARSIVLCLDGTWNKPDRQGHTTNVVRFVSSIRACTEDGISQIVYYHPGAGTGRRPLWRPPTREAIDPQEAVLVRDVPLRIKRRGVEMRLVIEGRSASPTTPDPVLLKEIRRAHRCFEALVSGQVRSVADLATLEGISDRYVSSLLPLAFLAPDIVEAIAAGRQPPELTAHRLIRTVVARGTVYPLLSLTTRED